MRKFTKIMLVIAGICFLLGGVITVAASVLGGRMYGTALQRGDSVSTRLEMVEQEQVVGAGTAPEIRDLKISVQAGSIRIYQDESADTVEVQNISEHVDVIKEMKGNSLELVFRKKRGISHILSDSEIHAEVILPAGYTFAEVGLEADAGGIFVDEVDAGELSLEVGAGAIEIERAAADYIRIECAAGAVKLNADVSQVLDVECDAGAVEVQLNDEKTDYNYELDASAGGIEIDGQTFGGLNQKRIVQYDDAKKCVELECDAGAIVLKFVD